MSLATRLILILGGTMLVVVGIYVGISNLQLQSLLRGAMINETEVLASALRVVSEDALEAGRLGSLDRALRTALHDEEVVAAVVLDPQGGVLAGGADDLACLEPYFRPLIEAAAGGGGWARCAERVFWLAVPLPPPGALLLVAQREITLNRLVQAALRRQFFLTFGLMLTLTAAIVTILRHYLARPLAEISSGLRTLGHTGAAPRLPVDRSLGEVGQLVERYNEMAAQLERQRRQLEQEMDDRIVLERQLRAAEKFAVIGRLAGGLAHELGSPLSVIGMRAEALRDAPELPDSLRRQAETVTLAVDRVSEVIQGMLHIARRQQVVFESVELCELIRSLHEEMLPYYEANEVQATLDLPAEPVQVRGQATLLRHALRNLLRNAVHAMQLQSGERWLRLHVETTVHEVRILLSDSGPGIPPEQLARIFEPFFSTKPAGEGLGLGLPISQAIIEAHGGELNLENRPGGGARVTVALPLHPDDRDGAST